MRHLIKSDIDKIRDAYNYAIHTTNPDRMKCTESFIFGYGSIEKSAIRFQSPKIYDNITDLIYDFVLAHRADWDPEYWKDE